MYQSTEQAPLNQRIVAETQASNMKMKQQSRNSNFTISQTNNRPAKFSNLTSAGQAYSPEKLAQQEAAEKGNPLTMRQANFRMGFEPTIDYGTTTD